MTQIVTSADFDSVTSAGVVLVDFYADWCGPCQGMLPLVDELSTAYEGRAKIVKINVDEAGDIAQRFGVMSIPTFKVLKNGSEVDSITGGVPKEQLVNALEKALA